jgi:hypothetical protein
MTLKRRDLTTGFNYDGKRYQTLNCTQAVVASWSNSELAEWKAALVWDEALGRSMEDCLLLLQTHDRLCEASDGIRELRKIITSQWISWERVYYPLPACHVEAVQTWVTLNEQDRASRLAFYRREH